VKAKVFPYQIFTTWMNATGAPLPIREALEKALNFSLQTVPVFEGKTYVFVDVSGSMSSPITGHRVGSTSKMRCVDVAALIASSLMRANAENVEVVMFDTRLHTAKLRPNGSVMENAQIIAKFGGGGTSCQLPMQDLVNRKKKGDLIIYISDNESWISQKQQYTWGSNRGTETAQAWAEFKAYNPKAKMVCIDLVPGMTTQVQSDPRVLNVGGFSDAVYDVIANFASQSASKDFWIREIEGAVTF
jgi:60 kDa SS-A/Ro ribonucleoprotein